MPGVAVCVAMHTGWAFRPKRGDGHWASRWAWCKTCRASTGPQKHGAERRSGRCAWRFPGNTQEFEFRQGGEFQNSATLRPGDSSFYTIADYRNKKTRQVAFCNLQKGIGNSSDLQIAELQNAKKHSQWAAVTRCAFWLGNVEEARRSSCHVASHLSRH